MSTANYPVPSKIFFFYLKVTLYLVIEYLESIIRKSKIRKIFEFGLCPG